MGAAMVRDQEEMTRLGFYGLAPFVFGAAVMWLSPFIVPQWAALNIHTIVLTYAGIILAFLAGAGAGAALKSGPEAQEPFLPRMVVALAAWFVILHGGFLTFSIPAAWRYLIVIALFVWLLMRDLRTAANGGFPSWYGALRIRLTLWAIVSLVLVMSRLILWGYY
ncbi:MAG TPA: hypothetical protein DEA50_05200 [Parvularcula sp.]|nr:hypothetical protein [Parvularcula sp.]